MKNSNRSMWKRIISSPVTMIILLIISIVIFRATWSIYDKVKLSDERLTQVQTKLDKLENRKDELSQQINTLSTKQGIEAELRTRFRAVKAGESVAVILDDPKDSRDATSTQVALVLKASSKLHWWQKLLNMIGL